MRLPVFWVAIALTGSSALGTLSLQAQPPAGTMAGIVLDRAGNAPLRRAVVTLSTVEARPQHAVAWTDSNGGFAFGYLPAGRYQLRVFKDGYQVAAFGSETPNRLPAIIAIGAGEIRNDFVFRLRKFGAISGVVVDEDGDPLAGAQVSVLTAGVERQRRRLELSRSSMTDGTGRYRFSDLRPGRYAVAVRYPRQALPRAQAEVSAAEPQRRYAYGTQYYPNTERGSAAEFVSVEAGQEIEGIDFRLASRPTVDLRGRVILPPGVVPAGPVEVIASEDDVQNRTSLGTGVSGPNFEFRFDNLPMGEYTIVAQATSPGRLLRGARRVNAGGATEGEIPIVLEPAIDLAGSVTVEGPDAAKYPPSWVALTPADRVPTMAAPPRGSVGKDGSFQLTGIAPGVWDIEAGPIPPHGYIKSMKLGDQDVLTNEMTITASTTARLRIVIATQAASVDGEVTHQGQPAQAWVVLAPSGKLRHMASLHQLTTADEKGHFEVKGVTPGSYRLYAFEEFDPALSRDPEALKPFEDLGVSLQLEEGKRATRTITLIPARAETHP